MINILKKYALTFIIVLLTFNALLLLSSLFPSSIIEKNVRESSNIFLKEGNAHLLLDRVMNDNYTDIIMINTAYSIDNTHPIYSYITARKNYNPTLTKEEFKDSSKELITILHDSTVDEVYDPAHELSEFLDGNVSASIDYARYWHGYLPFLRVLLIFFNVTYIRLINAFIILFLVVYLVLLILKHYGTCIGLIFAFVFIIYDIFYVFFSLSCTPLFIVMLLTCIILIKRIDKIKDFYLFFFIVGCISNFVDFLTVPLISLGIPLLLLILHKQAQKATTNDCLKTILFSCIAWGCGYGLTWASKWILCDILFKKGLIASAVNQVMYRTFEENLRSSLTISEAYIILFQYYETLFIALGLSFLIRIFDCKDNPKRIKNYLKKELPIFLVSILPLIWYLLLSNHTVLHLHFVYRHMMIFIIGVLILFKDLIFFEKE